MPSDLGCPGEEEGSCLASSVVGCLSSQPTWPRPRRPGHTPLDTPQSILDPGARLQIRSIPGCPDETQKSGEGTRTPGSACEPPQPPSTERKRKYSAGLCGGVGPDSLLCSQMASHLQPPLPSVARPGAGASLLRAGRACWSHVLPGRLEGCSLERDDRTHTWPGRGRPTVPSCCSPFSGPTSRLIM